MFVTGDIGREHSQPYMPDETWDEFMASVVWDFASYLGDEVVTPKDFVMAREWFILDTYTGINRFTGEPLRGALTAFPPETYDSGYPPEVYEELRNRSVELARTAFGDEFAEEANAFLARLIGATDEPFPNDVPRRLAA